MLIRLFLISVFISVGFMVDIRIPIQQITINIGNIVDNGK